MDLSALLFPDVQPVTRPPGRALLTLTVGESDSSGVMGIQADLRAFALLGSYGLSVATVIRATALNTTALAVEVDESTLRAQLSLVHQHYEIDGAKLGFIGGERGIRVVAEHIDASPLPHLVVDPDLVSPDGEPRLTQASREAWLSHLLSQSYVAVLNIHEAAFLSQREVADPGSMREAARRLQDVGAQHILVTGGRIDGHAIDVLFDGQDFFEFGTDRIHTDARGAGGLFSATLTIHLAQGMGLPEAVDAAKQTVSKALEETLRISRSTRVVDPMKPRASDLSINPEPIAFDDEADS